MPCNQKGRYSGGDALYGQQLDRLDVRHTAFGSFSSHTVYLDGIPPKGTSIIIWVQEERRVPRWRTLFVRAPKHLVPRMRGQSELIARA